MDKKYLLMFVVGLFMTGSGPVQGLSSAHWSLGGRDLANSRSQPEEALPGPANVRVLTVKWVFTAGRDISATLTITGSPVVFGDTVYVGVSSAEEGFAVLPAYAGCTFRGGVVALDARTGTIRLKTFVIPDNGGKPTIDPIRHQLYAGVANDHSAPASVLQCQREAIATGNPNPDCVPPGRPLRLCPRVGPD